MAFSMKPNENFETLAFHENKGSNIRLSNDRCTAERKISQYSNNYVFSERPLRLGQKLFLQVLESNIYAYTGGLAFGLTTCNPSTLNSNDLQKDRWKLQSDRSQYYWVVIKDVANAPRVGDELAFKITESGEVQMTTNRTPTTTLMHVDSTQKMWPFFELNGSTIKIKVLGTADNEMSENNSNGMDSNLKNVVNNGSNSDSSNECIVCYEKSINSGLYKCGHICMCYDCALKQWRESGRCPICRAVIKDVIRTYRC